MKIIVLFILLSLPYALLADQPSGDVVGWGDVGMFQTAGAYKHEISTNLILITSNATAVSAGFFHQLALRNDGTVFGWGNNHHGQAIGSQTSDEYHTNGLVEINGQVLSNIIAIATGNFSIGLRRDGTLVSWGDNKIPPGISNVIAIAAREFTTCAVKKDGTVIEWSSAPWSSADGSGYTVEGLSNAVAVAVGGGGNVTRRLALRSDGTVFTWGRESIYNDATPPKGLSEVVAIAAGMSHSLALKKDGTVIGWGFNRDGQATGIPTVNDPYITNGLVRIDGQILSNVVSIAANESYSLAIKKDGTVVYWGRGLPTPPLELTNVITVSAARGYGLAITTNSVVAERFRQSR